MVVTWQLGPQAFGQGFDSDSLAINSCIGQVHMGLALAN